MNGEGGNGQREEVAIIGMAGRFPGARSVGEFWTLVRDGVEAIRPFTAEELAAAGVTDDTQRDSDFVGAGAPLDDAPGFDAAFFGVGQREAEIMDPQHRILLECAWAALEDSGYDPDRFTGLIGVFGGVAPNTYFQNNLITHPDLLELVGHYPTMIGSEREYAISRIAFRFGLRGPVLSINTACSTSGVAIHQACQSLLSGECDMALAGGARIKVPHMAGYRYQEDGILSPDGHCRAFDAEARGTVVGNGAAMVVLKRLGEALADGDAIHAVIKGTAINNDGADKVGFTAPSVQGQARVIADALAMAEIDAGTVTYVEAHGTATALGDPIEVAALTKAFRRWTDRTGYCAIGSVKTNIGHLDAGAGVAGVIKTVLALKHRQLPPSLHFTTPNPQIDFARSPFFVNSELRDWVSDAGPRRAGVSSFGLGGTNAHIVLEEAPPQASSEPARGAQLILVSAKTEAALEQATGALGRHLGESLEVSLADAAFTLAAGRRRFAHRRMLVARDSADAAAALEGPNRRRVFTHATPAEQSPVVFMFPGGGAQYVGMGADLYRGEPVFRSVMDECAEIIQDRGGVDIRPLVYPPPDLGDASEMLERPSRALPALFAVEYAIARLWMAWGVEPTALIGHSAGEYAAACLGGALSLDDAIALVAKRGELFERLPDGAMLGVALSEAAAREFVGDGVSIAAINRPDACVLSGESAAIARIERGLAERGVDARRIHISVAAHSELVAPVLDEFRAFLRTISFEEPTIPWVSNLTGDWVRAEEAVDPEYWAAHLRQTVRFSDGLARILQDSDRVLLEVGPGQTLSTFARQHPGRSRTQAVVSSMRHPREADADDEFVLNALGRLWMAGVEVDWEAFYGGESRRRVPLPTYPFERKRYWIDPARTGAEVRGVTREGAEGSEPPQRSGPPDADRSGAAANISSVVAMEHRKDRITAEISKIMQELSGLSAEELDIHATFLELGFDSLFLTQANTALHKTFKVRITFRQLFEEAPSIDALAEFIDRELPPEAFPPELPAAASPVASGPGADEAHPSEPPLMGTLGVALRDLASAGAGGHAGPLGAVIARQLEIMAQQLAMLRGEAAALVPATSGVPAQGKAVERPGEAPRSHGPWKPPERGIGGRLTPRQQEALDELIARFNARTQGSKRQAQAHRGHLADPRTAAGFRRQWKELVYPIVCERAEGSRIWDVDGNEWIDITMGFGVTLFGHSPPFIVNAIRDQLDKSMAIGPQVELAGEVAALIRELTGMERAAFCNTGSEAVLAAIRTARTVTGRDRIAVFAGDYHGIFDEVLVRTVGAHGRPMPVAPGIPRTAVGNVLVLEYGDARSLDLIREHAHELAAVIVEPVQSRNPSLQPKEFVQALRRVTEEVDVPLVFDEIITGFRVHPRGAQAWYGVEADIATYGKVIGGGMPIGIVAGKARFLDALDGGAWQYGDDSVPEVGVTWFAGTFVRHPLALAATRAALAHLKEHGPALQQEVNRKTEQFAAEVNDFFDEHGFPVRVASFSSMFLVEVQPDQEFAPLFWHYLRDRGIHCHEGRPNFLTTAHSAEDMRTLVDAFQGAAMAMREAGFFPSQDVTEAGVIEAPITEEQRELWLACHLGGHDASCGFNLSYSMHFRGPFKVDCMQAAIRRVMARHDSLHMTIGEEGDVLRFNPGQHIDIPVHDLSDLGEQERQRRIECLIDQELEEEYDLAAGPLVRAQIARLTPEHHYVLLGVHHIASDGFSAGIIIRELAAVYSALCTGEPEGLPDAMQYREYAEWQWQDRQTEEYAEAERFWISLVSDPYPPPLELPTDRPRPPLKTFASTAYFTEIDRELVAALKRTGAARRCSTFSTLLAGYALWLHRITGQDDLVVGIPGSGQSMVGSNDLVGHCAHHHPLRSRISWNQSAEEFLRATQSRVFDAYEHRNYTEGSLVEKLSLPRDPSRLPLINVQFNMDPAPLRAPFHDLEADVQFNGRRYNFPDMTLNLVEADGEVRIRCEYNTDLFDADSIARHLDCFKTVLAGMVADPSAAVSALDVMPAEDRRRVVEEWSGTTTDYPREATITQLFEEWVERGPDRAAVVARSASGAETSTVTYGELNDQANRLAHRLQELGVGTGTMVGIALERSPDLIVAILGVLKAGGAYVPLDAEYPADRLAFMLEDTKASVLLTQGSLRASLPAFEGTLIEVDQAGELLADYPSTNVSLAGSPGDLVYVMYTSGSTGAPKGVCVTHRNVVRLVRGQDFVSLGADEVILHFAPISFDASTFEVWGALLNGGTLAVFPPAKPSPEELGRAIRELGVTTCWLTADLFRVMVDERLDDLQGVRQLLAGGDVLPVPQVVRVLEALPDCRLINGYGPTENTTFTCCYAVTNREEVEHGVPIGRPIANTRVYVLDERLQPVPIGVWGELFAGGDGVASGYHDRSALTAERFMEVPGSGLPEQRLYRTGDTVRFRAGGTLQFRGRSDGQVKIRGHRIELGEVESVLAEVPDIGQAAAVVHELGDGDRRLVAYVTNREERNVDADAVRAHAARKLPGFMVPQHVVLLDELPRTPNGKLDRKKLGELPLAAEATRLVEPRTETERWLVEIWRELLKVSKVSVTDDFFGLGGHSLLAMRFVSKLRAERGMEVPLRMVFETSVLEALASRIDGMPPPQSVPAAATPTIESDFV